MSAMMEDGRALKISTRSASSTASDTLCVTMTMVLFASVQRLCRSWIM
ncbi:Uncharacterised protein [Bordetella pertussis]|nr:Uncharacterised protein [Bordetella pertussis]